MFAGLKSFCFAVLIGSIAIQAAPLQQSSEFLSKRQIGDLQCNINRLQIVGAMAQMGGTLATLKSETASDPATSAAVAAAQGGLNTANQGVATIAKAIITGQNAPAAARTQVEDGLNTVLTSIQNATSSDANVTQNLQKLQTQLQAAGTAGNGVLANCK
ncbi:hypothetical protein BDW22DRAFT_204055 [Trametopsis cervina]|nr:hypothetical protein BDW22DRAFT_204055 [Trametopsis cervina]